MILDYDEYLELARRTLSTDEVSLTPDESFILGQCFAIQTSITTLLHAEDLIDVSVPDQRHWVVAGLIGESGEFIDLVKKIIFHRQDIGEARIIDEAGDVYWYLAMSTYACGYSMSNLKGPLGNSAYSLSTILRAMETILRLLKVSENDVMVNNIEKLRQRYPSKFELGGGTDR